MAALTVVNSHPDPAGPTVLTAKAGSTKISSSKTHNDQRVA
ncbi:MAG TPA: hypothetical protein VFE67_04610 [Rudaea sp.]|nr:hypothetical protein [Rudaea sp.]